MCMNDRCRDAEIRSGTPFLGSYRDRTRLREADPVLRMTLTKPWTYSSSTVNSKPYMITLSSPPLLLRSTICEDRVGLS